MRVKINLKNNPYWRGRLREFEDNNGIFWFEVLMLNLNTRSMRGRIHDSEENPNAVFSNVDLGMGCIVENALMVNLNGEDDELPYQDEIVYVVKVGDKYARYDVDTNRNEPFPLGGLLEAKVWKKAGMARTWAEKDHNEASLENIGLPYQVVGVKRQIYMTEV